MGSLTSRTDGIVQQNRKKWIAFAYLSLLVANRMRNLAFLFAWTSDNVTDCAIAPSTAHSSSFFISSIPSFCKKKIDHLVRLIEFVTLQDSITRHVFMLVELFYYWHGLDCDAEEDAATALQISSVFNWSTFWLFSGKCSIAEILEIG